MSELQQKSIPEELDERLLDPDPIEQFRKWFGDAAASNILHPDAMTLATSTPDGKPSARVVLLKEVNEQGFFFYTNYESRKGKDLERNPYAALVFYWAEFERQVRIEGTVIRTTPEESNQYFQTRPRDSQIGALASPQSDVVTDRAELERRVMEIERKYHNLTIPLPPNWGGFRVKPERIEFWKGRPSRLHDRLLYERQPDGRWIIKRLAP
ncbi:MAG: pyridoxamine 5'-phosphate oxidase [Candidatus Taylorbacteria bacterium]|nr:pyridoxamine 5'-phosphate oxidase [Candidatus Taylorbacteria bacterium]